MLPLVGTLAVQNSVPWWLLWDHNSPVQICEKVQDGNLRRKGEISASPVVANNLGAAGQTHDGNKVHVHLAHEPVVLGPRKFFHQCSNIRREAVIVGGRQFLVRVRHDGWVSLGRAHSVRHD